MIRALVGSVALVAALSACTQSAGDTPVTPSTTSPSSTYTGPSSEEILAAQQRQGIGVPTDGPSVNWDRAMRGGADCGLSYPPGDERKRCAAGVVARSLALPACVTEDQTTDCVWDGWSRGNGQGHSFAVWHGVRYDLVDGSKEVVE